MREKLIQQLFIRFFIVLGLLKIVLTQSNQYQYCKTSANYLARNAQSIELNFFYINELNIFFSKNANTFLKATSDLFQSMVISKCTITDCSIFLNPTTPCTPKGAVITCTLTGNSIDIQPWSSTASYSLSDVKIQVDFTANILNKTPKLYSIDYLYANGIGTANQYSCSSPYYILPSTPSSLKMGLVSATTMVVESIKPVELKYKPFYDTNSNEIQVLIGKVSYYREFTDQASPTLWSVTALLFSPAGAVYSSNSDCSTSNYYCISIVLNPAFNFLSSTEYSIQITNFNYPFHPLGLEDVKINVRNSNYDCETGSIGSNNVLKYNQFSPKTGSLILKDIQFCNTDCTATGLTTVNYSKLKLKVANPALMISSTVVDLIFNMDYFSFDSTDNSRAVSITFSSSTTTIPSSFTLNSPIIGQMKASFTLPSKQLIVSNDITIEISKVFMGLDTRATYSFYLNAQANSNINGALVSGSQFEMSYTALELKSSTISSVTIDNSIPFQIGQSQDYLFKIKPATAFTSSQMWIKIIFPSTTYTLNPQSTTCYKVILNGVTEIAQSSITQLTRDTTTGTIRILATFQTRTKVTEYTVSTCNIKNPMATGSSGDIQVEGNYASATYLTEKGVASTTIQPAQFLDGTQIAPLDLNKMKTSEISGYIFTLKLPVPQTKNSKLKIQFPRYLTNFVYASSSVTFPTQNNNPNISWEGILGSDVSDTITVQFSGYNPPITQTTYDFIVEMYDPSLKLQLSKTINYSTAAYTPRDFKLKEISRTLEANESQTTYTYKIQTEYFLETNFFMRIELHSTQAVTNLSVQETSSPLNLKALTVQQTKDSTTNYIDISSTFADTFAYRSGLVAEFTFVVQTITNYRSLQPLTLLIQTGQSAIKLGCKSTYSLTNNQLKPLSENQVFIQAINNRNFGEYSAYDFNMTFDTGIPLNGKLDIVTTQNLPTDVQIQSNPSSIFTFTKITSNKVRLTCVISPCKAFILTIRNILNPTFDSFSSIQSPVLKSIQTFDNASTDYLIQQIEFSLSAINYSNPCYTSKPYKSFCKECTSQNVCTSCYTTAIFGGSSNSLLDTVSNFCVATCPTSPTGTYEKQGQCLKCINNCKTCTSETVCQSCDQNFYLQGTTCKSKCDPTYFANTNGVCEQCDQTKCLTCTGTSDNCLSCQTGFGLITNSGKSQCVNCSNTDGYYDKRDNSGTCGICNQYCTKCSGSADVCSSCVDVFNGAAIYFNPITSKCTTSCERDGYNVIQSGNTYICGRCATGDRPCNTCRNQVDFCTSCSSPLYLQSNKCVTKSEIKEGFYGNDSLHTADPCSNVCTTCVSSSVCTACISNFYLVQGQCLSSCPEELPIPNGQGGCKEDTSTKVSNISEDNRVVPFPMLLASIAFCISIYFSKYEYIATFVPGCVVGFCSLFEWISWIALIGTAASYEGITSGPAILALLGFLFLYIVNVIQFIIMKKYVETDTLFMEWILSSEKNKLCFKIIKYSSLIISFKALRIIFSKYFNQSFFKAKVDTIDIFSPFNKLALVSVLMNSSLIIIASAIVTYTYAKQSQGFFLGLDSLIVTIMMIIFMIWESLKKKDHFEEPIDLNQTFSQRFFPFEQSYMDKMQNRALENSSRLHRGESNSSLADFKESRKVTIHENLQKPLQQVLDPNDMSQNAQIDKNVLKNSENGAPYMIQDHIYESYKPGPNGGKRYFEKKHVAPQFDYSRYNPIQENSNEDEMDDEENIDLQYKQNQSLNQSSLLKNGGQKQENARGFQGKSGSGFYGENGEYQEEEPVPLKPNTRHTIYYNENVQGMLNSMSTKGGNSNLQKQDVGVSIGVNMNDEEDEENKELRQRLYSKPSMNVDGMNFDQSASAQMMRQSYSPKTSNRQDNSKQSKTEGNTRSPNKNNSSLYNSPTNQNKKKSSPSKSRSISPSLAKVEDQKLKKSKSPKSPKKQKSSNSEDDPNMRNSQTSNKSNKSKKNSPKKNNSKLGNDDDNMLFYFAHPVEGDQALPPNQMQQNLRNSQLKQKQDQQKQNQNEEENNENKVERIMPIEENLDELNQRQIQPKYDLANQMKMKGPYNNDRTKARDLLGLENEDEQEVVDLQQNSKKGSNYQGSEEIDRNIYDSSESVRTAEEADMNYNEVSPSDFNVLNQRYEEDFFAIQLQQQIQKQQQGLQGQNLMLQPEHSLQIQSIQQGSMIQSPNNQMFGSQQNQLAIGGSMQQRPPLILGNSNSNISISNPKTTKSVGGGKKKSKSKPRSSSKNRTNISQQGHPFNPAILHQGLMTPTAGSAQGMRQTAQGFINQDNQAFTQGNNSPQSSYRVGRGADIYQSGHSSHVRPNSQDQSDGFMRSNTQNMYSNNNNNNNSRIGIPTGNRVSAGGSRIGGISPSNSNQVITYKVPQSDVNKLKSLEKIYLQRLEIQGGNQQQSSSKKPKKGKNITNISNEYNNEFDSQSAHSSQLNNFNGFYQPDNNRQARDSSDIHAPSALLMENPNSLVIADFGDDTSYKE